MSSSNRPEHISFIGSYLATWFGRGTWLQLTCPDCGSSVTFRRPTEERIRWYSSMHRCDEPPG